MSLESLYYELPLEVVARHEAGHAVLAHHGGGYVKRIVIGRTLGGDNFARAFFAVPDLGKYLLVLSGGALALFVHERPSAPTFDAFCQWVATKEGYVRAISGAGDWLEILRLTGQPGGCGIEDFLERAVRPYFDETIEILDEAREQVDRLTELLLAKSPGIGRRALESFFLGRPQPRLAQWVDRPSVLWAATWEKCTRR
jgi:hypothetical protein